VLSTSPQPQAQVSLNDDIEITFSRDVDLDSVNFNSVSFAVFDLNWVALQEQPRGRFALAPAQGADAADRRRLLFCRRFPTPTNSCDGVSPATVRRAA
jgi:hypothetical protein